MQRLEEQLRRFESIPEGAEAEIEELIRLTIEAYLSAGPLFRSVITAIPGAVATYVSEGLFQGMQTVICERLSAPPRSIERQNAEVRAFLLVSTVGFVLNQALVNRPELVGDGILFQLLKKMCLSCLEMQ